MTHLLSPEEIRHQIKYILENNQYLPNESLLEPLCQSIASAEHDAMLKWHEAEVEREKRNYDLISREEYDYFFRANYDIGYSEGYREVKAEVEKIEYILDDTNARYGSVDDLCIYCHSSEYNSVDGIVHKQDCIILKLRQSLKSKHEEHIKQGKSPEEEK